MATNKRSVILKLSGELLGSESKIIEPANMRFYAECLRRVIDTGTMITVVVGAGNIMRGQDYTREGYSREVSDESGMLATLINAKFLRETVEQLGGRAEVLSNVKVSDKMAKEFTIRRAKKYLEDKRVVIIACGTGRIRFSTDMGAAQTAVEIGATGLYKLTKANGLYTADPFKDEEAKFIPYATYDEVVAAKYRVMDQTAFSHCGENDIPITIFSLATAVGLEKQEALVNVLNDKVARGSFIASEARVKEISYKYPVRGT